ncbi:hypothetical protein [Deinococcus altitudinis]|uniref:hypothetical protein n=1 Tax=Deinococcus altitudinis TaxID=468914 RepID=UPI003892C465
MLSALQADTGFQVNAFLSVVGDRLEETQVSGMSQTEFAVLLEPYPGRLFWLGCYGSALPRRATESRKAS